MQLKLLAYGYLFDDPVINDTFILWQHSRGSLITTSHTIRDLYKLLQFYLLLMLTGQFADKATRSQSIRGPGSLKVGRLHKGKKM